MPGAAILGLDIGWSTVTAVVVSSDGEPLSHATASVGAPGGDPLEGALLPAQVLAATIEAAREAVAGLERGLVVRAIGLSGHAHAGVLLDEHREPLGPVLRGSPTVAAELLYLRSADRTRLRGAASVLPIKDFVALWLTGVHGTDDSLATATLSYHLGATSPDESIRHALGVGSGFFPRGGPSLGLRGAVTESAARALGVADGVPVVRGSTDAAALAVGVGAIHAGDAALGLTKDARIVVVATTAMDDASPGVECHAHATEALHCMVGSGRGLGAARDWYLDVLCDGEHLAAELRRTHAFDILLEAASTSQPGAGGLLFVPGQLRGAAPSGALLGIEPATTKADVSRAVVEGLCLSLRRICSRIEVLLAPSASSTASAPTALGVRELRVAGTWGSEPLFRKLLADVLGIGVAAAGDGYVVARGAALQAAVGTQLVPSLASGVDRWTRLTPLTLPDPSVSARYVEIARVHQEVTDQLDQSLRLLRGT